MIRVKPKKNFAEHKPSLIKDWDYEKNIHSPYDLSCNSAVRVWWKCHKCNYEWKQSVRGRKGAQDSCHKCNSLGILFPEISQDWDYEKNILTPFDVPKMHSKKVWWKCHNCNYSWESSPVIRVANESPCKNCSNSTNGTSKIERKIFFFIKKIHKVNVKNGHKFIGHMGVDIYIPSKKIAIEYDGRYWHSNKELKDVSKSEFLKKIGVKLIRIREIGLNKISDQDIIYNPLKDSMNYLIREIVSKIHLNNSEIKRFNKLISENLDFYKIPKEYMLYPLRENSLLVTHPQIIPEWDYEKNEITPDLITFGQNIKIWWKCKSCNGSWHTNPYIKIRNVGCCKFCNNKIVTIGKSSFSKEWDYNKNKENPITISSKSHSKKYWWKCKSCSTEYQSTPSSKTTKIKNCPKHGCDESMYNSFGIHKSSINYENSILNKFPTLAKDWDIIKNKITPDQVPCGANKKAWWNCHCCGHQWESIIYSRIYKDQPRSCSKCRWS